MKTVIYLANQRVQAVIGTTGSKKINVKNFYTAEAPEGSIINGLVVDSEAFVGFLKEFWSYNKLSKKDVTLVVNSNKFVGKTIELPVMSERKTFEYIVREFADVKKDDEAVYGFLPLEKGKKDSRFYAGAVTPELISDYIDIFTQAGITLDGIYSGECSLISLVDMTLGKRYKNFLLEIADATSIAIMLWVNGSFYYFNSVRSFHEQGTEEYARDIARSISQINQFMQANHIEYELESIVLAGVIEHDMELYREIVANSGNNVPLELFDSKMLAQDKLEAHHFLYASSGLYSKTKNENFLWAYRRQKKKSAIKRENRKGFFIVGATLVVMIIAFIMVFSMHLTKEKELNELISYNEDPAITMQVNAYDLALQRGSFLTNQYNAISRIDDNLYSYPICDQKILDTINECAAQYASISFQSFSADEGRIDVIATSGTVEEINVFIKRLREQDIFNNIDYTGYTFDENTKLWDIHVMCTLAPSAGR